MLCRLPWQRVMVDRSDESMLVTSMDNQWHSIIETHRHAFLALVWKQIVSQYLLVCMAAVLWCTHCRRPPQAAEWTFLLVMLSPQWSVCMYDGIVKAYLYNLPSHWYSFVRSQIVLSQYNSNYRVDLVLWLMLVDVASAQLLQVSNSMYTSFHVSFQGLWMWYVKASIKSYQAVWKDEFSSFDAVHGAQEMHTTHCSAAAGLIPVSQGGRYWLGDWNELVLTHAVRALHGGTRGSSCKCTRVGIEGQLCSWRKCK